MGPFFCLSLLFSAAPGSPSCLPLQSINLVTKFSPNMPVCGVRQGGPLGVKPALLVSHQEQVAEMGPAFPHHFGCPCGLQLTTDVPWILKGLCSGLSSVHCRHTDPVQQHQHPATGKKMLMSAVKFKSLNCFSLFLH